MNLGKPEFQLELHQKLQALWYFSKLIQHVLHNNNNNSLNSDEHEHDDNDSDHEEMEYRTGRAGNQMELDACTSLGQKVAQVQNPYFQLIFLQSKCNR
jgi:hypothetical protein